MSTRAFISYRRETGSVLARLVKESLEHGGCEAFLDVDDLGSGQFDSGLLQQIEHRPNFVLLCTPGALDRCREECDVLRMEVVHALQTGRNIVPLVAEGFEWPNVADLPAPIRELSRHNDVRYSHRHWESTRAELLRRMRGEMRPFRITLETAPARFEACREVLERLVAEARQWQGGFTHEVTVRLLGPRPTSTSQQMGLIESLRAADLLLIDIRSPLREQMLYRAGLAVGLGIDFLPIESESSWQSLEEPPRSVLSLPEGFPLRSATCLVDPVRPLHHLMIHIAMSVQQKFR